MRQHTTPEQTANLIELGFERPKSEVKAEQAGDYAWYNPAYSIGELIELLSNDDLATTRFEYDGFYWFIYWDSFDKIHLTDGVELIDALYDMIIKLKEEVKTKAQDALKCNLCEVALAQSKPEKHKDDAWHTETDNCHFEVMRQMNDMTNNLNKKM